MSETAKAKLTGKEILIFVAIALSSLVVMTDMAVTALVSGAVLKRFSKKSILVCCGSIFTISLLACAFVDNPYLIAALRAIAGIMTALVNVAAMGALTELFPDDNQQGWLIGFYNSITSGMGMILSFGSGILAVSDWHHSFWIFAVSVPMVLGFIFVLPRDQAAMTENEQAQRNDASTEKFSSGFYIVLSDLILFFTCYGAMTYFVSVYVVENQLGNEAFTGTVTSVSLAIGIAASLLFGYFYSKMKRKTVFLGFVLLTVSIVLRYAFPSQAMALVGESIGVVAYTTVYAYAYAEIPSLVPPSKIDTAIGLITFVYAVGNFICTYMVTALQSLMQGASYMSVLPVVAAFSVLPIVFEYFVVRSENKNK